MMQCSKKMTRSGIRSFATYFLTQEERDQAPSNTELAESKPGQFLGKYGEESLFLYTHVCNNCWLLGSPLLLAGQGVGAMQAGFFIGSRIEVCVSVIAFFLCQASREILHPTYLPTYNRDITACTLYYFSPKIQLHTKSSGDDYVLQFAMDERIYRERQARGEDVYSDPIVVRRPGIFGKWQLNVHWVVFSVFIIIFHNNVRIALLCIISLH